MAKPIIAVDIDEVLMPHFDSLIAWYNEQYDTSLTGYDNHPTDPGNWGTDDVSVAIKRVHKFYETDEYKASNELIVVTARDTIIEASTELWLEDHFQQIFSEIHFTNHFSLEGKRRDKSQVLKELGAEYFVDDSLENVFGAAELGIESILFGDFAWNQEEVLPSNVTRCKDWEAVRRYFNGIST